MRRFEGLADLRPGTLRNPVATVGVFFLNGEQREIGLGKVEFHFIDRIRKTPRAEAPRER